MMMRRGREPREIASAMLEGKTGPSVPPYGLRRDGTRYDRRWNTLRRNMRGDSKQYIDDAFAVIDRAGQRKFDGRIFKETLRTTTKSEAREAAKRFRNMKTLSVPNSGGLNYPVVVNARVVPRSGGYSVFVRAREITPSGMQIEAIQRVAAMEARLNTEALRRRKAWRGLR